MLEKDTYDYYSGNAQAFLDLYDKASPEEVHKDWLHLLPETKAFILDVGAGSGRDAHWFALRGHEVTAVEPVTELRLKAQQKHPHPAIQWIDDSLPGLKDIYKLDQKFDIILVSAVWNHVHPNERERAFRKLVNLLKPGGKLIVTIRHGLATDKRIFHESTAQELHALARKFMIQVILERDSQDGLGRPGIYWSAMVFLLPDDGTHALPLLRHVIINDAKASTYKLALLRVLLRIADSSKGMIIGKDKDYVTIPFGLVALYWVRMFKPLVFDHDFRQSSAIGLGFVKDAFRNLKNISPYDLRIGARFEGSDAINVLKALRDARNTIKNMPANYTTYPGTKHQIFICESMTIGTSRQVRLDLECLSSFGTFKIPRNIWENLSRYACWIEPAIINEWCGLMKDYDSKAGNKRMLDEYVTSLTWLEAERDTEEIRGLIQRQVSAGRKVFCVWTGNDISRNFAVDHCFPFAYWPNNDLWNLLPSKPDTNLEKSSKLPSAIALERARERILDWWNSVYRSSQYEERFFIEAKSSLPSGNCNHAEKGLDYIYSGLQRQRAFLRVNQQIGEWNNERGRISNEEKN